jgi:hypothetical protein
MGRAPKRAEQKRGVSDRLQALAPDIPDDDPGSSRGAGGGVQVVPDLRLGFSSQVDGSDAQGSDPLRKRPEHHLLCGRRHGPQLGHFLFMALPPGGQRCHERRHQDQNDQLENVVQIHEAGAHRRDHGLGQDSEQADTCGRPGAGERRSDSGCGDQKRPEMDAGRRQDVNQRDDRDQRDRHRE